MWREEVSKLPPGPALDEAIARRRAEVLQWPASVRHLAADAPWLTGCFAGEFDPRLELVATAELVHVSARGPTSLFSGAFFDVVRAFGARLDPAFAPPDVLLGEEDDIRSANGCGGGRAWWERGSSTHSIRFESAASESPSQGMLTKDQWVARGLAAGCSVLLEVDDFSERRKLSVSGPCPAVLELAPAWAAVLAGARFPEVQRVLSQTRAPWRE